MRSGSETCPTEVMRVFEDEGRAPIHVKWESGARVSIAIQEGSTYSWLLPQGQIENVKFELTLYR